MFEAGNMTGLTARKAKELPGQLRKIEDGKRMEHSLGRFAMRKDGSQHANTVTLGTLARGRTPRPSHATQTCYGPGSEHRPQAKLFANAPATSRMGDGKGYRAADKQVSHK